MPLIVGIFLRAKTFGPVAGVGTLLLTGLTVASCSTSDTGSTTASATTRQFTAPPADCAAATSVRPVADAVRQYAGTRYGAGAVFTPTDLSAAPGMAATHLICNARFGELAQADSSSALRYLSISFTVNDSPGDAAAAAADQFQRFRANAPDEFTRMDIGDDADTRERRVGPNGTEVRTRFRMSNLTVDVITSDQDYSGAMPAAGADPELAAALRTGAEAVARALAGAIGTVMPAR
ncbi:hypothetical protein JK358_18995 [Nocardia sp. 2]|uniref:DUF3558 domain-containing protein n=1 Tax=Nocardia acididurans TaxID=2802282 RepID=A0ABS1M783_9NOCA|nr:hypothetical protein [Nocardia acididurans]MBL1076490.1 hypothetical protein [Nocardia acididurans]